MSKFNICASCGANNDHGEICECVKAQQEKDSIKPICWGCLSSDKFEKIGLTAVGGVIDTKAQRCIFCKRTTKIAYKTIKTGIVR